MSKRVYAPVNPDMLVWARKSVSYDLIGAAKRIGLSSPSRLEDFEKGRAFPTTLQLLKISKVYDCPFAAFFFSKPPNQLKYELKRLGDWRKIPGSDRRIYSPKLILELRLAMRRRDILLDVAAEMGEEIHNFAIAKPDKIDMTTAVELAENVRNQLGISVHQQHRLGSIYNALRVWRNAVEQLGVIVSQTGLKFSIETNEMRGVAIYYDKMPIVLINGKDSPSARIFTIMHELGHLVLREGGISNNFESNFSNSSEVFCNAFAGELLVPQNDFLEEKIVKVNQSGIWEDTDLKTLAGKYKVSKEVVLLRLLTFGKTKRIHYSEKVSQWKQEWEDEQEKQKLERRGYRPPYEKYVRNHGARYVSSVLEAYGHEIIHAGQLSEYLGAKLHYVPDIARDLSRVTR